MGLFGNNYVCALDIGSSKLVACVARFKREELSSIAFASVPSKGMRAGVIVDSIDLINSITALMKDLRAKTGISVKYVYTTISGRDVLVKHSRAIIPLAERGNKVITVSDIRRVNEQACVLGSSLDDEIIQMIPVSYTIDTKSNITNPLGLYSHRLEAEVLLICAKVSGIQGLTRIVNQAGCEIRELFFSGFVSSKIIAHSSAREGVAVFCDVGSDITEVVISDSNGLRHVEILPMGGNDITLELSNELKVPLDLAEELKRSYGSIGNSEHIGEDKEILIKKTALYKPIKQRLVAEIVTRKAHAMCARIKEAVEKKVPLYEIVNFTAAGRSMILEGFIEALEATLGFPVKIARPADEFMPRGGPILSGQTYLTYLSVLGILNEVIKGSRDPYAPEAEPVQNPLVKAVHRFREVYQEYF